MKIKNKPLVRGKPVNYFNHRYGVVEGSSKPGLKIISGLLTAVFVVGGMNVALGKFNDYQQKRTASSHQRQSAVGATSQKTDESDSKLKNATTKAREDEQLAKQIKSKLKNVPGGQKWSVYVRDLQSDRMASINADDTREAAGFSNLFMTVPLEAKTPSSRWSAKQGGQSLASCVQTMLSNNDQACAQTAGRYADMKNADNILAGHGFKKTTLTDKKKETTAREMGDLLFRLQNSQLLSDKARRTVFDGLYGQQTREGLFKGCEQQNCLAASIASESKGTRHDAAIITSGGTKYVVVVMTNEASWSQIADVSAEIFQAFRP